MAGIVVSELLAVVGIEADKQSISAMTSAIDGVKRGIVGLGAALVGGAVVSGIASFTQGVVNAAGELANLSARTDISTRELQRMSTMTKTVGVDMDGLGMAVEKLSMKFAEVARTGGEGAEFFRSIGVEVRDSEGHVKTGSAALLEYLDAVAEIPNAAERAEALNKVDRRLRDFGPLVANGTNELREFLEELGDFEGITQGTIEAAGELEVQQAKLGLAFDGLRDVVASALLPPLIQLTKWATDLASGFVRWTRATMDVIRQSAILEVVLVGLGVAATALALSYTAAGLAAAKAAAMAAAAWIAANAPMVLAGIGIAFVILLVEDLVSLFQGGKSVIGEFIDELFGVGTAEAVVKAVSKAFEDLVGWVTEAIKWVARLFGYFEDPPPAYEPGDYVPTQEEIDALNAAVRQRQAQEALEEAPEAQGSESGRGRGGRARASAPSAVAAPPSLGVAPTAARAPASPGGSSRSITQQTEVQITVQGNPSEEERRRIAQVVNQTLERRNREAADDLLQEGDE